jgi:DNA polymerase III alpha subunit (gram-positive type)
MKYIYFAIATTGLDHSFDDIIKLSLSVEEYRCEIHSQDFNVRPRAGRKPSELDIKILDYSGVTIDNLRKFEDPEKVCYKLISILKEYTNKGKNKLTFIGHNNDFDFKFINAFITMYTEYKLTDFVVSGIDLITVAKFAEYSLKTEFKNYKLKTLGEHYGFYYYKTDDIKTKIKLLKDLNTVFINT